MNKVYDVGFICMTAVMLSPGKLAIEHIDIHSGHLF